MENILSACYITKNGDTFLKQSVESIYNYVDEIIVVDNMSTDNTMDIVHSFPQEKFKIVQENFDNLDKDQEKKNQRNRYLEMAEGKWILVVDDDEVYKDKDIGIIRKFVKSPGRYVSLRYFSHQFWKDFDHVIKGPHWNNSQERCFKKLPNLNYNMRHCAVSEGDDFLARKYGKKNSDRIFWNKRIFIYHYGMCKPTEKVNEKIRMYMLRDNPAVTEKNVESFVQRHPYNSNNFDSPRFGPTGLWIAGNDQRFCDRVYDFEGEHPEVMRELVKEVDNE
jgi:glycosyltransferase involved in cell wall biosynthesis